MQFQVLFGLATIQLFSAVLMTFLKNTLYINEIKNYLIMSKPSQNSDEIESIFSLSESHCENNNFSDFFEPLSRENVTFWHQFKNLAKRSSLISIREPRLIYLSIITSIIFSLFIGALYYRIDLQACGEIDSMGSNSTSFIKIPTFKEIAIASQNTMGSLIFMSVLIWYTSLQYVKIFSDSSTLFQRETSKGYRVFFGTMSRKRSKSAENG